MTIEKLLYQGKVVNVIAKIDDREKEIIDDTKDYLEDTIDLTEVLENE